MLSKSMRMFVTVSVLAIIAAALIACGGVSQTDFDAAKQSLAAQDQKVQTLQQQLSAKEKELADAKKQAAAPTAPSGGSTMLLGAKQVPTPTPRPPNTPVPAGYVAPTAPPPPVPPAAFLEPMKLYIHADTTTSGPGESSFSVDAAGIQNPSCVATSVFKRGMSIVWRFEVVDTTTGKRLTDNEVASAIIKLPTGEEVKGRFGRHGSTNDSPWFWAARWDVPLNYPLGVLDWTLTVSAKDGKTGSFKLWNVSIPDRGVEARTQIID